MCRGAAGQPFGQVGERHSRTGRNGRHSAAMAAGEDALLLRLLDTAWQICARFTGHGAAEWSALDEALRHGIVRFAAHQYRERDEGTAPLPAAIAALWRPYRPVRL